MIPELDIEECVQPSGDVGQREADRFGCDPVQHDRDAGECPSADVRRDIRKLLEPGDRGSGRRVEAADAHGGFVKGPFGDVLAGAAHSPTPRLWGQWAARHRVQRYDVELRHLKAKAS